MVLMACPSYIYICIHTHVSRYMYTYMYIYIYICRCIYAYTYMNIFAYTYVCMYLSLTIYMYTDICAYEHIHTYVCTRVCIYLYRCLHMLHTHAYVSKCYWPSLTQISKTPCPCNDLSGSRQSPPPAPSFFMSSNSRCRSFLPICLFFVGVLPAEPKNMASALHGYRACPSFGALGFIPSAEMYSG